MNGTRAEVTARTSEWRWMKWAFLEACMKTGSKAFQKLVGLSSKTFNYALLATAVGAFVQCVGGFVGLSARKKSLFIGWNYIWKACLSGLVVSIGNILVFSVFIFGGDIGVNTFIITLSIIPGALIDKFFFGNKLSVRQWLGIAVGVLAGYAVIGWPSLSEVAAMPLWVWLSFGCMMSVAINQGFTQGLKNVDPFVNNFWVGGTTFLSAIFSLLFIGSIGILVDFSPEVVRFWFAASVVGLFVIGIVTFALASYKDGANIAIKKLVMNGLYLTMAMILGAVVFDEALSFNKISGIFLYVVAFSLMDNTTWNYLTRRDAKKPV